MPKLTRAQFRSRLIQAMGGDVRFLWMPKANDATIITSEETSIGRIGTPDATVAARLSKLGLGYQQSFNGTDQYISYPDTADMSFNTAGTTDLPVSFIALANVTDTAAQRTLISKFNNTTGNEWTFDVLGTNDCLRLLLADSSAAAFAIRTADAAVTQGSWHLFAATYDGTGGATAANGIALYQDGVAVASTATNNASYVAMENLAGAVEIGSLGVHTLNFMSGSLALVAVANVGAALKMVAITRLVQRYFGVP